MKKILLLSSVITCTAASVMAQGYFNANNQSLVSLQVSSPTINSGTPVTIGTPAVAAGFADAGKSSTLISMYVGANGTSLAALKLTTPAITVTNSGSGLASFQGTFAAGNPFTLPSQAGVFDGSAPVEVLFLATTIDGKYAGYTSLGTITPAAAGSGNTAPAIFGPGAGQINSFLMTPVPEPTTMALGGLGAAALLYFRRRK